MQMTREEGAEFKRFVMDFHKWFAENYHAETEEQKDRAYRSARELADKHGNLPYCHAIIGGALNYWSGLVVN